MIKQERVSTIIDYHALFDQDLMRLSFFKQNKTTVNFTVVCLVTRPLSGSEAGVDLVLIQTLLLYYVNAKELVLAKEQHDLQVQSRRLNIKTRSTPASLPLNGQVTKHTTFNSPYFQNAKA